MKKRRVNIELRNIRLIIFILLFGLVGCTDHPESKKEEGHDHGSESSGASFEEGKGISLSEETKKSLGLEIREVSESSFQPEIRLTAQVYRSADEPSKIHGGERQGYSYATALVSSEVSSPLQAGQKIRWGSPGENSLTHEGSVFKIDPAQLSTWGRSEALLELSDHGNRLKVGEWIEVEILLGNSSRQSLNIPRSALLETSSGTFAFVKNGDFFLRTEIKIGDKNKDSVEITEGLYEGDTLVTQPVEALYMIELQAVKGGGHCH